MIPLRSVKISGHVYNLAVKCHATESTYSKNNLVIPKKFSMHRSCIKSSIEVLTHKSIKYGLKIIPIYLTSIINFN